MATFFLIWLFLYLWSNLIQVDLYDGARPIVVKANKITEKVHYIRIFDDLRGEFGDIFLLTFSPLYLRRFECLQIDKKIVCR